MLVFCSLMQALPGLRQNVTDIIEESTKMIDAEQTEDDTLKGKHGAKWTRTPSSEINATTRRYDKRFNYMTQIHPHCRTKCVFLCNVTQIHSHCRTKFIAICKRY